jgi:hypothetical protein
VGFEVDGDERSESTAWSESHRARPLFHRRGCPRSLRSLRAPRLRTRGENLPRAARPECPN